MTALGRTARWPLIRLVGPLLVGALGCAPAPTHQAIALRWIEEDPGILLQTDDWMTAEVVEQWPTQGAEARRQWQFSDAARVRPAAGGFRLDSERDFEKVDRRVDFDASAVDAIHVTVRRGRRGNVTLLWAEAGERFAQDRRMTQERAREHGDGWRTYRFEVRDHPEWRGPIGRVRIGMELPLGGIILREVTGLAERVAPDALARALGRPWKAELGGENP